MTPSWPEEPIDLVPVVRPTPELDIVRGGWPARRKRSDVVKLQEPPLTTPMTVLCHELAAASVTGRDGPPDIRRWPACFHGGTPARHRPLRGRELPSFEIRYQEHERPVEHLG